IPVLGANAHWDEESEFLVAEGDESDGTLALYRPTHSIILNVEEEHLDYYKGLEDIEDVFRTLVEHTSERVIYCAEDAVATKLGAVHENSIS
ncbi:MAG: UDP-N-acetylenolpyruvoylglucosamine reductase, partial [Akkermansiaceae bacterium]|nr:UDP-N-acetylenolpyruvoylglucosamine reductase [Akkermansiaceae bacterium]